MSGRLLNVGRKVQCCHVGIHGNLYDRRFVTANNRLGQNFSRKFIADMVCQTTKQFQGLVIKLLHDNFSRSFFYSKRTNDLTSNLTLKFIWCWMKTTTHGSFWLQMPRRPQHGCSWRGSYLQQTPISLDCRKGTTVYRIWIDWSTLNEIVWFWKENNKRRPSTGWLSIDAGKSYVSTGCSQYGSHFFHFHKKTEPAS